MAHDPRDPKPATSHTRADLEAFAASLPPDDGTDAANVGRGFIGTRSEPVIEKIQPNAWMPTSWDLSRSDFVEGPAPDTVNPALWRQAGFNAQHGLYEVCDGFYQVRGFDTSSATFIRGDEGWVVIDPLTTAETARAAYELVTEHLGARPVTAVIYTHSHLDHYGGILGMVDPARIEAGEVRTLFNTRVTAIEGNSVTLSSGDVEEYDQVFLLTGYHPDDGLLGTCGLKPDPETLKPVLDPETLESRDVPGLYLAGSVSAGYETGNVFIENGRFDCEKIFADLERELG